MAAGEATAGRRLPPAALAAGLLVLPAALVLAFTFLAPLARLLALSFSDKAGAFAPYAELLGDDVYRRVFANTALFAVVVTGIALVIAYPLAFALTRLAAGWRAALFACVLFPLWISVLVRTFSWMLLLEKNGPVNRLLVGSGLSGEPVQLLFNHTGVLIGMVHVLLPYAVLPIYAALLRIDPALLRASEGLGASRWTTFRRVLLPLSMRGVATAASFVFLLSLGFFITPALMGGAANITLPMLIESLVNERLAWPLAAAASIVLLAATLLFLAVMSRVVPVRALAEARCMAARLSLNAFAALMAALLVLPILAVVPAAFSERSFIRLPPETWSLRWWGVFFADPSWRQALVKSLEVATLSAGLAVVLGTAAALGLARAGPRAKALLTALFLGPVVVPVIVLAVALYSLARTAGLVGTTSALVIAHTMLALPYVTLNVGVSLAALDPRLGLAAAGLGADPWRIFRTVTLPLIAPGVVGGAVFAFVTSFDEVVLSIFLSGPTVKTLPVRIWEEIRVEYTPLVAVAATVMIALALAAAVAARLVSRR